MCARFLCKVRIGFCANSLEVDNDCCWMMMMMRCVELETVTSTHSLHSCLLYFRQLSKRTPTGVTSFTVIETVCIVQKDTSIYTVQTSHKIHRKMVNRRKWSSFLFLHHHHHHQQQQQDEETSNNNNNNNNNSIMMKKKNVDKPRRKKSKLRLAIVIVLWCCIALSITTARSSSLSSSLSSSSLS